MSTDVPFQEIFLSRPRPNGTSQLYDGPAEGGLGMSLLIASSDKHAFVRNVMADAIQSSTDSPLLSPLVNSLWMSSIAVLASSIRRCAIPEAVPQHFNIS